MKRVLYIFVSIFIVKSSFGQNTPRFGQPNFAQGIVNPAALAIDSRIMVDMVFRNQWAGFAGAPSTGAVNAQFELYHDMAAGLAVSYDLIGVHHETHVSGQYSYRAFLANGNAMIFGASVGIDQRVHDLASAQTIDANDPKFATTTSKLYFNSGFGMFYNAPNFYIGASIPQLFENRNIIGIDFRPYRWHYNVSGGLYAHVSERYTFNPNFQLNAVFNAPIQADIVLRNTFSNSWSLVVGYRTENAVILGFDFLVGGVFRMGYSFNYGVDKLATIKGMSNELYVGIGLPYHNSREEFGQRRYLNKKGKFRRDFRRGYDHRKWYK
ncbi:MAG: PorP/SprF family type IX secretion system membrane protein [Crocinitomicaceae bacterium]|nr:PorP/SprF family type IX secretion system membrane protein [Crocinitomicaceae bacterium]